MRFYGQRQLEMPNLLIKTHCYKRPIGFQTLAIPFVPGLAGAFMQKVTVSQGISGVIAEISPSFIVISKDSR